MQSKFCPKCMSYMMDSTNPNLIGWKYCPTCRYSEDAEGYNLLNPKPVQACEIKQFAYQCDNCKCGDEDESSD